MKLETPDTIRLEIPKRRVVTDLLGMTRHLAAAGTQGALLQNWPGAVASLFSAAGTLGIKRGEGALAWELLLTGIGEALTELANENPPTLINEADVKVIENRVCQEATGLFIPVDFLDRPGDLSPVQLAKRTLLKWLAPPKGSSPQQDLLNLSRRFDAALVLGLYRTLRRDEVRYGPLIALRKHATRPAWELLEDWNIYRAGLVAEFRTAPVFDESFALDQIYMPLNAWHWVEQASDEKAEPKRLRNTVRLTDDILAWLRGERGTGRLRLVSGGPGSGKSSAVKALAAELSESGDHGHAIDTLLFPLQRFQWRSGIIESVASTLNTYGGLMRHNPLVSEHLRDRHVPLLLIFDGLDELTTNSEVGYAISANFLRELSIALRNWKDRPIWAIVTGRDAIFGHIEGPTERLPGEQFHLLPYHVRELEPDAPSRGAYHDPDHLLDTDSRDEAFHLISVARGQPSDDLPDAYLRQDLHDVTAQPLLNYFLLSSGPDQIADGNVARIYSNLFKRLHDRNRNVHNRAGDAGKPGAGLDQDQFDRIFEAMAVAAWRTGGSRTANWNDVLAEAAREDAIPANTSSLQEIFNSYMHERGAQKPFRLAAAFFMRNQQATGIEFTHKSFGDYLYARRLVKAITDMAEAVIRTPAVEREMLHQWEMFTADQRFSPEVRRFLELEIDWTIELQTRTKLHKALAPTVEKVLRDGWPVTGNSTPRRAEQRAAQMEEALFVAWHGLWSSDDDRRYWSLGENTGDLLWRALARQKSVQDLRRISEFARCCTGADLSDEYLVDADFSGIDLSDANLENTQLGFANFSHANLRRAHFRSAELDFADINHANLDGANLSNTLLIDANFCRSDLTNAVLEGTLASDASFERAVLSGAVLRDAGLRNVNFNRAKLTRTNFEGADLDGADFSAAKCSSKE